MSTSFKHKKILIIGMGRSGLSAFHRLQNEGCEKLWGFDDKSKNQANILDTTEALNILPQIDLCILSPGIPSTHTLVEKAKSFHTPIWGELELGFYFLPKNIPIIAITGSNGKTTTVLLLENILKKMGKNIFVGGNIGTPLCELSSDTAAKLDYVVLENSSFQLETIQSYHPRIAACVSFSFTHGERYKSEKEYAQAKLNILKNMTEEDLFIFKATPEFVQELRDVKTYVKLCSLPATTELQKRFDFKNFKMKGLHNIENLQVVWEILKRLSLTDTQIAEQKEIAMQNLIDTFAGVSHRTEFVTKHDGFTVYNDSKSTNWDSTIKAIQSFETEEAPLYLLLGGKKRGLHDEITEHLKYFKKVEKIFLRGEIAQALKEELGEKKNCEIIESFAQLRKKLRAEKFTGVLLFSPAFPSFDLYKNYEERGEDFKKSFLKDVP